MPTDDPYFYLLHWQFKIFFAKYIVDCELLYIFLIHDVGFEHKKKNFKKRDFCLIDLLFYQISD